MKVLVISGGGCKGAFGGGIAEYLINDCKKEYDLFVGTSVGSLLIPLFSIGEIDKLKNLFSTVTQSDIFNTCPFVIYKKDGVNRTRINHLGIVKSLLRGKKSFGESLNLRKLIQKTITECDFEKMLKNKPDVLITVSNLTTNTVEYKSLKECTYPDFCDWIWASANLVPFMSLVTKDGYEYGDGGMGNIVPIYEALKRGACEIDIILLNTEKNEVNKPPVRNALELTARSFDFMLNQIIIDDIVIGMLEGMQRQVNLTFYRPPVKLTDNALIFDRHQMKQWWIDGYLYAKNSPHDCKSISTAVKPVLN
jgi:predicted patatin/cPLA2 family phospholipase